MKRWLIALTITAHCALWFAPVLQGQVRFRLRQRVISSAAEVGGGGGTVDFSEYRIDTYGAPDHYCDGTRSLASSGDGTIGNAWNYTQCKSEPVAGDVIGHLNVGAGTPVELAAPNSRLNAAFLPANEGVWNGTACTSRIVHVARWAAVNLPYSGIESNTDRSEIRHAGADDAADVQGNGGAAYGVNGRDCITWDGFFVDMAQIGFRQDAGVTNCWDSSGIEEKNFVFKGKQTDADSNAGLLRTENCVDILYENYTIKDFTNVGTGGGLNQDGEVSVHYGTRNVRHRHFRLENVDRGHFLKGTAPAGVNFNWGLIEYGLIINSQKCFAFNDLHATEVTIVRYNLCYSLPSTQSSAAGITWDSISTAGRNIHVYNNTFAKIEAASGNSEGCIIVQDLGLGTNVEIRDNICDVDSGVWGHLVLLRSQLPAVLNYNGYTKNGATRTYVFNDVEYNTFAAWKAAISGRDANSIEFATSPFVNRAGNDFHVAMGHAAATASSTGGEIGAYGGATETIGPITE